MNKMNNVPKIPRAIAPVPFWQNVLLFSAGKCFVERQWLRDSISQVCAELNDDPQDNLAHLVLAGSRMAVSLLEDGPARRQPAYAQALARRALGILALPAERIHERLSDVYEASFDSVYREELSRNLHYEDIAQGLAAWVVLAKLIAEKDIVWAKELTESHWPQESIDLTRLFEILNLSETQWARQKYAQFFFEVPLMIHRRYHRLERVAVEDVLKSNKLAKQAMNLYLSWRDKPFTLTRGFSISGLGRLMIPMISISGSQKLLSPFVALGRVHEYWKPLKECAILTKQLSHENVANFLEKMVESYPLEIPSLFYATNLPWPVQACLAAARRSQELQELASRMRRGEMGEVDDWVLAEDRWRSKGVNKKDLSFMTDNHWPIPKEIARIGFPFACLKFGWHTDPRVDKGEGVEVFWRSLPEGRLRGILAEILLDSFVRRFGPLKRIPGTPEFPAEPELMADIISKLESDVFLMGDSFLRLFSMIKDTPNGIRALDVLGDRISIGSIYADAEEKEKLIEVAQHLAEMLERNHSLDGALNLLTMLASSVRIDIIPTYLNELSLKDKSRASKSALVLQLARQDVDARELIRIAQNMLEKLDGDEEIFLRALRIYENHQMENYLAVSFLEKILHGLPKSFFRARRQVIRILTNLLGQRVAPLSDRKVWEKLGLPICLFSQLRN